MLKNIKIQKILDAGCGEGVTLSQLKANKIGKYLEGIDFSNQALLIGKKLYPTIKLKKGNIYKLPYKNNAFDFVLCTEVLEHLKDPEAAIKELYRVTSKYCLLSVPNEPIFGFINFLRGIFALTFKDPNGHVQYWSPGQFEQLIRKNGFRVICIKLPFPWIIILAEKY